MQRTIHVHVGGHKTATTYIQSRLRSNRRRLCKNGVEFVDLWAHKPEQRAYRKAFKKVIESAVVDERKVARMSERLQSLVESEVSSPASLIVLSYENLLGNYDLTRGDVPYPNTASAIRHVCQAFPGCDIKIFLSIRSLDRFLESGYVQLVCTRREHREFRDYLGRIDLARVSWLPVVNAITSVAGREALIVWSYEDFVVDAKPMWDALLGRPNAERLLVRPAKKGNHSLSEMGLRYMRRINEIATPSDAKKFRTFVLASFGSELGLKKPKLLREVERRQLILNYERDLMELVEGGQLLLPGRLPSPPDDLLALRSSSPA